MRVGVDVTPLLRAKTGIAVCTQLLLDSARATGHEVVGLASGWRRLRDGFPDLPAVANWWPWILNPVVVDWLAWPKAETFLGPLDIFVATNHEIFPTRKALNVALLHDVGRLKHPHLYSRRQVVRFGFKARRLARFADVLAVPTESVAHDVIELGLAGRDRVRTVPWPARPLPAPAVRDLPTRAPLLLCVATLERHKNIPALVRAFQRAAPNLPHHLVLAGGGGTAEREVKQTVAADGAVDRIHFLGHADPRVLSTLYRHADLAICPSLYEGFGLTLLEAMANGCPVLASDIPAHREVGGRAVRLVPPHDEHALVEGLVELARDEGARAELKRRGLQRSRRFSTQETGRHLRALLSWRSGP